MQFNVSETGRFLHYKVTLKSVLFKKGTGKQSCYMRQILCFFFSCFFIIFHLLDWPQDTQYKAMLL